MIENVITFILELFLVKDAYKLPSLGCALIFTIVVVAILSFIILVAIGC